MNILTDDKLREYAIFNGIEMPDDSSLDLLNIQDTKQNPILSNNRLLKSDFQYTQVPQETTYEPEINEASEFINESAMQKENKNVKAEDYFPPKQPDNFVEKDSGNKFVQSIYQMNISDGDKKFLYKLSKSESGHNPNVPSKTGKYKGAYQFSTSALHDIGMTDKDYESSVANQHMAALKYGNLNLKRLSGYTHYIGSKIKGITITREGIMAASHLGGTRNVKAFFDSNGEKDFKDANGTPISKYMKMME